MSIVQKLDKLIRIQNSHPDTIIGDFNSPVIDEQLVRIEQLVEQKIPEEIVELYRYADGQNDANKGVLLGEKILSSREIISHLEFIRTLIKPERPRVENEKESKALLEKIVNFYIGKASKSKLFWKARKWYKLEVVCRLNSFDGPYLYKDHGTTEREREILEIEIDDYKEILKDIQRLHMLEKESYNWDALQLVIYSNRKFDVIREYFNFDVTSFTSTPEGTIKKKHFNNKWLPIFSDHSGNFIGVDLDPDSKGTVGQVINFGRDEKNMFVYANSLERFLAIVIEEIEKPNNNLLNSTNHLHEDLKRIAK